MKHVMVDLETLGTTPGCSILSIGAVAFDPVDKKLGDEFYIVVQRHSQMTLGLHEDKSTLEWWQRQSADAKKVLTDSALPDAIHLSVALGLFTDFLFQFGLSDVRIWGNGADFDNAILACCYRACNFELPWRFWNNRCYRTAKNLLPGPVMIRTGTLHNALDDAISQANHLMEIWP